MEIEFDQQKSYANAQQCGLPFTVAGQFDFETALFDVDVQHDCGEVRIRALGMPGGRVHALVFKETATGIRVISRRKANKREVNRYEQEGKS